MRRPVSRGMRYAPNVRRARGARKRRPAMKKTNTVRVNGKMIFKGHKLTIGLDLGDHWSCYCVLDEAGKILLEQKVAMTPEAMKQVFAKIPQSLIAMETGTHSPWVSRLLTELGHKVIVAHAQKVQLITKSNRKDDRHDCADTGTAGTNRSGAIGAGTASQCASANPPDGDPGARRTGACANGLSERGTRVGEVLWAAPAQVWHTAGEPGAGRRIARRVARGSGAAAPRSRITERAHPGIRRADGANRQQELPASRTAQTSEGSRNADRADVRADPGRSASVPEESRGRLFSGVVPWAQRLR